MHIIFDTSILVTDFVFKGQAAKLFFESAGWFNFHLHVPELVFKETTNKYAEQTRRLLGDLSRYGLRVQPLFWDESDTDPQDLYRNFLASYLERHNVSLLGFPKAAHLEVATRAIETRRPFKSEVRGYRDTLLWLSTLELAQEVSTKVVLLTADSAFYDEANQMHQHLSDDLSQLGIIKENVSLYKSYKEFNDNEVFPNLEPEKKVLLDLRAKETSTFDIEGFLEGDFIDYIKNVDLEDFDLDFPSNYEDPSLSGISGVHKINLDSIQVLKLPDDNRFLVNFWAEISIIVDFFVYKSELYEAYDFSVEDPDWNSYYAWASKDADADIEVEMILNLDTRKVESAQIANLVTSRIE